MSLHSTISDRIKNVVTGKRVKYDAEPYVWTDGNGAASTLYWTITRTAESSFQYLALTKAGAESSAQTLVEQYTRKYARWTAELDESTTPPTPRIFETNSLLCTSDITPAQAAGDAWRIDVDVNDTDTIIVTEKPETYADMERLFTLALARDAEADDTNAPAIVISSDSYWDSTANEITIFWDHFNIGQFDTSLVVVQRKFGDNWIAVPIVADSIGDGGCKIASDQNLGFRISYNSGAVISNYFVTTDEPMPSISIVQDDYFWSPLPAQTVESGLYANTRIYYIDVVASGSWRALAAITNSSRWYVLVNGRNNGSVVSRVIDQGENMYRLTVGLVVPHMESATGHPTLNVTVGFSALRDTAPSSTDSVAFPCRRYAFGSYAKQLSMQPSAVRAVFLFKTDLANYCDINASTVSFRAISTTNLTMVNSRDYDVATNVEVFPYGDDGTFLVRGDFNLDYSLAAAHRLLCVFISDSNTGISVGSTGVWYRFGTSFLYLTDPLTSTSLRYEWRLPFEMLDKGTVKVLKYDPANSENDDGAVEVAIDHRSSDGMSITFAQEQADARLAVQSIRYEACRSPWLCNADGVEYLEIIEATFGARPDIPTDEHSLVFVLDCNIPAGENFTGLEVLHFDGIDFSTVENLSADECTPGLAIVEYTGTATRFQIYLHTDGPIGGAYSNIVTVDTSANAEAEA